MRIGLISDTHGYLDARALAALEGVDLVLHAGDVGSVAVLEGLRALAPVQAVRGNNDDKIGGLGLPFSLDLELEGHHLHLVHRLQDASPPPGTEVVVTGHSHVALAERRGAILYVNPGAAGRAGFHRLQTVALLELAPDGAEAAIVELGPRLAQTPPRRPTAPR